MRTVFVPSQFYGLEDLRKSGRRPDLTVKDVCDLCRVLPGFLEDARLGREGLKRIG